MKTALVIGASRGLGLGLVRELANRGWAVVATVRDASHPGELATIQGVEVAGLDINHTGEVIALRQSLRGRSLDLLFVNAGIMNGREETIADVSTADFTHLMTTNALSPMRVIEELGPLVTPDGTIAAMSSGLGSVSNNTDGGMEAYRASKAALNTLLRSYAARAGGGRTVIAASPGWVKTDMGGQNAPLDVATSARGLVSMLESRAGRPECRFVDYQDRELAW